MIRKLLKILGSLLLLVFLIIIGFCIRHYHADIPVEELKEKYTYEDSKFIDIEGMDVHYRMTGEGRPLLLLHGSPASLHTWEEWTTILSKDFQVISVDLPGYGLTGPHPSSKLTMDLYKRFVNLFTAKIGVDTTFSMAGSSYGGNIIWNYSIDYPEKVDKIILIGASGYPFDENYEKPISTIIAENPITAKLVLSITPKSLVSESLIEVYADKSKVTEETIDQYFMLNLREGNRQTFVDRVQTLYDVTPEKIKQVKVPTLVMWGEKDIWASLNWARSFHKDIEGSQLLIYPDVGHLVMEEIPEVSAAAVKKFLLEPSK